jgi:hypothetical protein
MQHFLMDTLGDGRHFCDSIAQDGGSGLCLVHRFYLGVSPEQVLEHIRDMRCSVFAGGACVGFEHPPQFEAAAYHRYQAARRQCIAENSARVGVLVDDIARWKTACERLTEENPGLDWIVVPTQGQSQARLLANGLVWKAVGQRLKLDFGFKRLTVAGCVAGGLPGCVAVVAEFLNASGIQAGTDEKHSWACTPGRHTD